MELKPHFRVVRFSPVPEFVEPINVALLIVDSKPRLVTDSDFEKLACVAPSFDRSVLQAWLEIVAEDVSSTPIEDVSLRVSSRTSQIQLGTECFVPGDVPKEIEQRLIEAYLKRPPRPTQPSEQHLKYVDSLIEEAIGGSAYLYGDVLKRAKPKSFLSRESVDRLPTKSVKFSRVLVAPRAVVIMDGLNLAVASRTQLRQRAHEIAFGFFAFSHEKRAIEEIEQKQILRTSFVFNRPTEIDGELELIVEIMRRDSDISIDAAATDELRRFNSMMMDQTSFTALPRTVD